MGYVVEGCGGALFATMYCSQCGAEHHVAISCNDRACPDCRERSYRRLVGAYGRLLDGLDVSSLALVSLTTRVGSRGFGDLRRKVVMIRRAFTRLRHRKEWKGAVAGGVYTIEVMQAESGWNVHIHALVQSGWQDEDGTIHTGQVVPYTVRKKDRDGIEREYEKANLVGLAELRGDRLSELWATVTEDKSFVTDITPVRQSKGGVRGAVSYILKYLSKPVPLKDEAGHDEYRTAMRGARLVSAFGAFHGELKIPKGEPVECPVCGCIDWMSEHELRRLVKGLPRRCRRDSS